eukprot:TRINITY_DN33763_c0_g1_i1.p1 TRINITY_DN33763_c0_g1~~TRINITY_DN33763_c0_g1_i1.p1  ORF type:complete len:900 (-),score=255.74 TRINITY_DN33763_c0_g1_i1:21-2720(-)
MKRGLDFGGDARAFKSTKLDELSGSNQIVNLEVPQSAVKRILGAENASIKAIRSSSGAQCLIKQMHPRPDVAMLTISGKGAQVEKCKAMVLELVDDEPAPLAGTPSLSAVTAASLLQPPGGIRPALRPLSLTRPAALGQLPQGLGVQQPAASSKAAPAGIAEKGWQAGRPVLPTVVARSSAAGPMRAGLLGLDTSKLPAALAASLAASAAVSAASAAGSASVASAVAAVEAAGSAAPSGTTSSSANPLGAATPRLASLLAALAKAQAAGGVGLNAIYQQIAQVALGICSGEEVPEPTPVSAPEPLPEKKAAPAAFDKAALARLAKEAASKAHDAEPLGVSARTKGGVAEAPVSQVVAAASAAAAASLPAAKVAPIAVQSQAPRIPRRDAKSVLGIMQQAHENLARNIAASSVQRPKDMEKMGFEGPMKNVSMTEQIQVVEEGLDACLSEDVSAEVVSSTQKDVLGLLSRTEANKAAELVIRMADMERLRSAAFLDDVARKLVPLVAKLNSSVLTRLVEALALWASKATRTLDGVVTQVSNHLAAMTEAVATEVALRLMDLCPSDITSLATSLASLGEVTTKLFSLLARAAVARSDRFKPRELTVLLAAFDRASVFHSALLEEASFVLRSQLKELSGKDLVRAIAVLAADGYRDEDLADAIAAQAPKLYASGSMSAEEMCSLVWAFCCLDLYHEGLFREAFRALDDASLKRSESLCQLYEIHLALKTYRPEAYRIFELDDETVLNLQDHYRRHRGGAGRYRKLRSSSQAVLAEVFESAQNVVDATVQARHQTAAGLWSDIGVVRKRSSSSSSPVALLDLDGPSTLLRSLDNVDESLSDAEKRVRGTVTLKRRLLSRNGGRLAVVDEDKWSVIDDKRLKRDYLRELLLRAGVGEDKLTAAF